MKKIIYIFIFICLSVTVSCYSQYLAKWNGNTIDYNPEYNVMMLGNSSIKLDNRPPFTIDSIFNWQYYQFPFPYTFTDISFVDLMYGWATYTGNGVARTTDGGISWDTSSFGYFKLYGRCRFYKQEYRLGCWNRGNNKKKRLMEELTGLYKIMNFLLFLERCIFLMKTPGL